MESNPKISSLPPGQGGRIQKFLLLLKLKALNIQYEPRLLFGREEYRFQHYIPLKVMNSAVLHFLT